MENQDNISTGISRRQFAKNMALAGMGMATGALAVGGDLGTARASTKKGKGAALKGLGIEPPSLNVRKLNTTAERIYQCKPGLARFESKNMAFKQICMDLGAPTFVPQGRNMIKAIQESRIGHDIHVKNVDEARAHLAFHSGAATWNYIMGPYGEGSENKGNLSWNPLFVNKELYERPLMHPEPADLAKKVKQMARMYGADATGITQINRKWIYASTCRNMMDPGPAKNKPIVLKGSVHPRETDGELVIPDSVKYAIVFAVAMPRVSSQFTPASLQAEGATTMGYGRMGLTAVALAEAIRSLAYNAIPCMNDTGMSVPLAIDAGLGQLGRLGYLITPWFGPHVRLAKVLTDMPMATDSPIDFGVTQYCESCGLCAKACPAGAISADQERNYTVTFYHYKNRQICSFIQLTDTPSSFSFQQ
jgi:reductive dehalogenase